MKCRDGLGRRERALFRREAIRFSAGVAVILASMAITFGVVVFASQFLRGTGRPMTMEDQKRSAPMLIGLLTTCSIPIAVFTRKESRSDLAEQILREGARANPNDNPAMRFLVCLALIGLVYGEFMVIDAIKAWWIRAKLRRVDRDRAAVILAILVTRPEGCAPGETLRHGEPVARLRQVLAYLITFEWIEVSRDSQHMMLLSPAKRALKS